MVGDSSREVPGRGENSMSSAGTRKRGSIDTCSFCGKAHHEVAKLIAGPDVNICNECVSLCADIVAEDRMRKIIEDPNYELIENATSRVYVRLSISKEKQGEFLAQWRNRLSAVFLGIGANSITYLCGDKTATQVFWHVIMTWQASPRETREELVKDDSVVGVVSAMQEAGVLLKRSRWYFVEGVTHK